MHKDRIRLDLCNLHLQELFRAIERGDVRAVEHIEHVLTPQEECVACTYSLRANGEVKQVLDSFLQQEGYLGRKASNTGVIDELVEWGIKIALFAMLFFCISMLGTLVKTKLYQSTATVSLGSFGITSVIILALSIYILMDQWFFE
jgi:hypothetical protein